jgi:NAD(P)-dependent dehydrogenase (short-subunit alcohol dehydrogenase family)
MKSVLVTGAGRGIGKAIALKLAADGWDVYAGVRKPEDGEALQSAAASIKPVLLDVTDDAQVAALADSLPASLDAVVNNAGIVFNSPIEAFAAEDFRQMFEINVFGAVAVTQAVLPKIRAAQGRVVFISSISGRIATPWTGAYSGSKAAIELIADSLRMELRPWKIKVSVVEPGATETDIWGGMIDDFDASANGFTPENAELYAKHTKSMRKTLKVMQKTAVPTAHVVKAVEKALVSKRPRARYPVGIPNKIQIALAAVTPTPVNDAVVAKLSGVPRKP